MQNLSYIKQLLLIFLQVMFSFRYTSDVCKHKTIMSYRMAKDWASNSCSYLHQILMDFT